MKHTSIQKPKKSVIMTTPVYFAFFLVFFLLLTS